MQFIYGFQRFSNMFNPFQIITFAEVVETEISLNDIFIVSAKSLAAEPFILV